MAKRKRSQSVIISSEDDLSSDEKKKKVENTEIQKNITCQSLQSSKKQLENPITEIKREPTCESSENYHSAKSKSPPHLESKKDNDEDSDTSERPWDSASEDDENSDDETKQNSPIEWSTQIFDHPGEVFVLRRRPKHDLPISANAIDYLGLFLDDKFWENLVTETNKYAEYYRCSKNIINDQWTPVSKPELKAYIGIQIYLGIVQLPTLEHYFFSNLVQCPIVSNAMTCKRFIHIGKYLHLTDEESSIENTVKTPLYKIKPVLEVAEKFIAHFQPDRDLAVDETTIGFKGKLPFKRCMPQNPRKRGIKVWSITESQSGYVLRLKIYLGKKEPVRHNLLLGEQVVLDMTEPFYGMKHHVYFNNFFGSVRLMEMLEDKGLYSCCTMRTSRKGWPEKFRKPRSLNLKPGEILQMQKGHLTATIWHDKGDVAVLSNNCNPLERVEKKRRDKSGNRVSVKCPLPVVYNQGMGGVGLSDQHRSYYRVGRKFNKWWKYVFYFVINIAIYNAFILHSTTTIPHNRGRNYGQLQFREDLVKKLIGDFTSRKQTRKKVVTNGPHILVRSPARRCVLCAKEGRKTNSNMAVRSTWMCQACQLTMCQNPCFSKFHGFPEVVVDLIPIGENKIIFDKRSWL